MPSAASISFPPPAHRDGLAQARSQRVWLITGALAAVALVLAAIGGYDVVAHITELPKLPQLAADLRDSETLPRPNAVNAWLTSHAPAEAVLKSALLAGNGQIDARLSALLALACHVTGLTLLIGFLGRACRLPSLAVVALAAILLPLMPALAGFEPLGTLTTTSLLLPLGLAHLLLMTRSSPTSGKWWLGLALGVVTGVGETAGLASAAAIVGWSSLAWLHDRRIRPARATLVANAVLLGAELALAWARSHAAAHASFTMLRLASWPLGGWIGAAVVWFPALACIGRWALAPRRGAASGPLALLSLWAVVQIAILGAVGTTVPDAAVVLGAGLLISAACCLALPANATRPTRSFVLRSGWAILVVIALLQPSGIEPRDYETGNAQMIALARAIRGNDPGALRAMPGSDEDHRAAESIVATGSARRILPVSIRPALPLHEDVLAGRGAFAVDNAPPLSDRDSLPVVGTWVAAGSARMGDFVSAPLTTDFPLLQLRVGGTLQPPASTIVLRTKSGREIAPMSTTVHATERWRRINFAAPHEPFRIVARTTLATEWLGFTAPVEVGPFTRLVAKLPPSWPTYPLAAGLLIGAAVAPAIGRRTRRRWGPAANAGAAPRRTRRDMAGRATRFPPWHVFPWLAVFAYAVFFSFHLDPTAGPNDSGGYLNSAKLLVRGQVTASPRTIFGAPGDGADITPYLPITFHAAAGRMVPEYPVGWPLEIAAVAKLVGLARAVPLLMVVQLVLGVVITQRLARRFGLPDGWAWLAAGIVGLSPVYLFEALQPVSDGPALVWVTAAVYWAWLSRERWGYAIPAGLATAAAVMIRPSNLLCTLPVAVCLFGHWRQVLAWGLAGLPGAAWLAWYQQVMYGSWHTTGYGDISSCFGLRFIAPTLHSYATWLPEFLTPLVVLALAVPFLRHVPARIRIVLATWAGVFIAFYAVYWCTWDNWYNMRFVLPAFPAMITAALLVARAAALRLRDRLNAAGTRTASAWRRYGAGATAVLVMATLGFVSLRTAERRVPYWMASNHKPGDAAVWAREHLPANAVIFAKHLTGSLFYYTDLTFFRLDHPAARTPELYARIAATGRPIYAMTAHWETHAFDWAHAPGSGYPDLPGKWERIAVLGGGEFYAWKLRTGP